MWAMFLTSLGTCPSLHKHLPGPTRLRRGPEGKAEEPISSDPSVEQMRVTCRAARVISVNKPQLAWKCASPVDIPVGQAGRSQGEAVVVGGEDPTVNCKHVTAPHRASGDVGVSSPGTLSLILGTFCTAGSSPSLVSASVMRN